VEFERMTGVEKAAVLALALPDEAAQALLSRLGEDELERVLAAVASFDEVPGIVRERVLAEFRAALDRRKLVLVGGRARAVALARGALDGERADRVTKGIGRDEARIDRILARFEPGFIARTLAGEHPQTIALVLSQLSPEPAAAVVAALPGALGADVVIRLASLELVPAAVIAELEAGIAELFDADVGPAAAVGGKELAARILNRVPRTAGHALLEAVDARDPGVAAEIRRRMLRFDELRRIDRRGFQMLLREVPIEDLVLALKATTEEMREKVFENVSSRAAEQIREEAELLGAVRRSDVERVQERIVEIARRLEEEGRLELEDGESVDAVL
jgi:flagellar motor switch protein FliG